MKTCLLRRPLATLLLALALASPLPHAQAATLPDAVRFGVVGELGDIGKLRDWLDAGLPPDFRADRIGTGLMIGAWTGNIAMMELFLAHGADINASNAVGEQALQLAAWHGHLDAVKWLVEHGAATNRKGKEWSALHYAVFAGHREVVNYLLARGADVNARIPNDATVLMMAAREGHEDLARQLIAAGADPRLTNDRGENALAWAMRNRHYRVAQVVAAPAEFAKAVKAPPASFGKPIRSQPAPIAVSDLLRQLRQAEASGQPSEALRQAFFEAVENFKRESRSIPVEEKTARHSAPSALVITAQRQSGGGERAELVYGKRDVADILQDIRTAQATGKPVAELRKELFQAVSRLKGEDETPRQP